jgi:predicted O-methyltransferase YrrM
VAGREAAARGDDWTQAFIAAMHRNASERAGAVVRAVGAAEVRRMLDVGGGSGAYSIAFAKANPELAADILDLAEVGPIAQGHIERAGVADRVRVRTGDLRVDKLGQGYDLVFVSAICHMLDENENRDLLGRCRDALRPGGRIVVQEFILEPDKTAPKSAALFALNMLVGTRAGSAYSEPEYAAWLAEAGFRDVCRVRLPGPAGLMIATR